jgi:hypothetical protein
MGERRGAYRALDEKPEGRRPLGRPRRRWENSIKCIFERLGGGVDWIDLAQDRDRWRAVVNAAVSLRVRSDAGNLSSWGACYLLRKD